MTGSGVWQDSTEELAHGICTDIRAMRQAYASLLAKVAAMENRGAAFEVGYACTLDLVVHLLTVDRTEATTVLEQAVALHDTTGITGAPLPAALPITAQAARDGSLGTKHIDVIRQTLTALPATVPDEDRAVAEQVMVDFARDHKPRALARLGRGITERLNPDGTCPTDTQLAQPACEFRSVVRDGQYRFIGVTDIETGKTLDAMLSALSHPRRSESDTRSRAERHGDAFAEIVHLATGTDLPIEGGAKPTLTVTVAYDALAQQLGTGTLDDGTRLDAASVRRLACDAHIIPVVMGGNSQPLDIGHARKASTAIRRALIARDQGCAFPDCERPPPWCDSHHVDHWSVGGTTRIDNMVLLCKHHHRLLHHTQWTLTITNGRTDFQPPNFLKQARAA